MLGSDGPNVSKAVWRMVNDEVTKVGGTLLDVGTCILHKVHNAFAKGIAVYGHGIPDLIIDINRWFKLSAARSDDFVKCQRSQGLPEKKLVKHCETRWLSLKFAVERLIELWPAIVHYSLNDVPKSGNSTFVEGERYRRIRAMLERMETVIELRFLESVANVFQPFLTFFQREEPLIHVMHEQVCELLRKIMSRYMKVDSLSSEDLSTVNCKATENFLDYAEMDIGVASKELLSHERLTTPFLNKMREFLMITTGYLQEKLPFENKILKSAKCLKPEEKKLLTHSYKRLLKM